MEKVSVVGLDLAKNVFQVHGANAFGKKVLSRRLKRSEVMAFFAALPPCRVGMEACGGAHEWARRLAALGHAVKLMAPQYVKAYVQGSKTDARDAAAICEATGRDSVPTVAVRSRDEQQVQALHRVRDGWMKQRTATANQIRGLIAEFGGGRWRRGRKAPGRNWTRCAACSTTCWRTWRTWTTVSRRQNGN